MGRSVVLLEAKGIGESTTGDSTGNLYASVSGGLSGIEKKFNEKVSQKVVQSRIAAVNFIEETVNGFSIKCNFGRKSWFLFSQDPSKNKKIEKEQKAA